jgi:membrane protease YdiL (CAAX protease family)
MKKSFLYSLPLLWPFMGDFIYGLYNYGSEVLSHWQWPHGDPSTLSLWGIFDGYFWHPFVIFSFSWNLFFLCVVQTTLQKHLKPKWAVLITTCIWSLWHLSLSLGVGIQGNILGIIGYALLNASLFFICSYAFYKSNSIVGQVLLFGILMLLNP